MKENFQKIIPWIHLDEGEYSDDEGDPGGPTRLGITIYDYKKWTNNPNITAKDVKDMPADVAEAIYKKWYWDKQSCDLLPTGIDYFVFDCGLLSGTGTSIRWLQRAVNAKPDGNIGPKTLEAISKMGALQILLVMEKTRRAHLKSLPHWVRFGPGWTNRVNKSKARAVKLIEGKV
jgi:lysozyme family protein